MNWTTEQPKKAGLYWAYGKSLNKAVPDQPDIVSFDPAYDWVDVIGHDEGIRVSFYTHWGDRLVIPDKPKGT